MWARFRCRMILRGECFVHCSQWSLFASCFRLGAASADIGQSSTVGVLDQPRRRLSCLRALESRDRVGGLPLRFNSLRQIFHFDRPFAIAYTAPKRCLLFDRRPAPTLSPRRLVTLDVHCPSLCWDFFNPAGLVMDFVTRWWER